MTDKEIIFKHLSREYELRTHSTNLVIVDRVTNSHTPVGEFFGEFYIIFGDFTTDAGVPSFNLFRDWIKENSVFLYDLNDYVDVVKHSIGVIRCIEASVSCFENEKVGKSFIREYVKGVYLKDVVTPRIESYLEGIDKNIDFKILNDKFVYDFADEIQVYGTTISKRFNPYYFDYVLKDKIHSYLQGIDLTEDFNKIKHDYSVFFMFEFPTYNAKLSSELNTYYSLKIIVPKLNEYVKQVEANLNSAEIINKLTDAFDIESLEYTEFYQFSVDYINNWYSKTVVGEKMNDILSQLVITPTRTDWTITWIGHGPTSKEKIMELFKHENRHQMVYLKGMFESWYDDYILEASERLRESEFHSRRHLARLLPPPPLDL